MSADSRANTSDPAAGGWVELQLGGPLAALEVFADYLAELGSGGSIFSEDPSDPGGGQMVTAFLSAHDFGPGTEKLVASRVAALQKEFPGLSGLQITKVEDRDWAKEWKEGLRPERLPPGVWIVPVHCAVPEEAGDEPVIRMDPGLAFGTGAHETTRLCLELIGEYAGEREPGFSVLDLGAGTAILAMAAALLGASGALAIDIDPVAVRVARENIGRNGLAGKVEAIQGVSDPGLNLGRSFDLVVANIFPEAISELLPFMGAHLAGGGALVLSGIILERKQEVIKMARDAGFELTRDLEDGAWTALRLKRERKSG